MQFHLIPSWSGARGGVTTAAVVAEGLMFIGVKIVYREIAPIIYIRMLGLLMAIVAYC